MGMGSYANYADTVEEEFVKEICSQELDDFKIVLDKAGVSMNNIADAFSTGQEDDLEDLCGVSEEEANNILNKWRVLCKAFYERTGGLGLDLVQHEANDEGDDLDGWSFCVEGVYILSEAGKKYNDKIERKFWTVFG